MPITLFAANEIPVIGESEELYAAHAQGFAYGIQRIASELNAAANINNLSTLTTSTTSNNITTGSKTFTVPSGLGFAPGLPVRCSNTASPLNYGNATVTSYSSTTLIVNFDTVVGTGTAVVTWTILELNSAANTATLAGNTFTGVQNFAQGVDVVAASTTNLDAMTGNSGRITGNTTITIFTLTNGRTRDMVITGTPLLTYNATTNNLNSNGANYQCTGGERLSIVADTGVVRVNVIKSDGTPLAAAAIIQPLMDYGGVNFNGVGNLVSFLIGTESTGTAITDSKKGTFVSALRFQNAASAIETIFDETTSAFNVSRSASGNITISAKNTSGTVILSIATTGNPCALAGTYSIMASWDLAVAGSGRIYINHITSYVETTFTNDVIDYTQAGMTIGRLVALTSHFSGDIYSFYFDETANIDFNLPSNRYKFTDTNGNIVFMGLYGELPLGYAPCLFFGYGKEFNGLFNISRGRYDIVTSNQVTLVAAVVKYGYYADAINPNRTLIFKLKADQVNNTITLAQIGNPLSSSYTHFGSIGFAGDSYRVRVTLFYTAAAITTGMRLVLSSSASAAYSSIAAKITETLTATTELINFISAQDIPAAASVSSLLTGNVAIFEGLLTVSGTGQIKLGFASEVASSAITILKGSTFEITRID